MIGVKKGQEAKKMRLENAHGMGVMAFQDVPQKKGLAMIHRFYNTNVSPL
jgi:hypothetical protein